MAFPVDSDFVNRAVAAEAFRAEDVECTLGQGLRNVQFAAGGSGYTNGLDSDSWIDFLRRHAITLQVTGPIDYQGLVQLIAEARSDATNANTATNNRLDSEIVRRGQSDTMLMLDLMQETSDRQSADINLANIIANEIHDREDLGLVVTNVQNATLGPGALDSDAWTRLVRTVQSYTAAGGAAIDSDLRQNPATAVLPVTNLTNWKNFLGLPGNFTASDYASASSVTQEAITRGNADTSLNTRIDALTATVSNNLTAARNYTDSEVRKEAGLRAAADTSIRTDLTAEINARTTGDNNLQGQVNNTNSNLSSTNLTVTNQGTRIANLEAQVLGGTGNTLVIRVGNLEVRATADSDRLTNEITRAMNAEASNRTAIANETTARRDADTTLTNNLDAEIEAREMGDSTLTTNLAAEVARAQMQESVLQTNITDLGTSIRGGNNQDTISSLRTSITTETSSRRSGDSDLGVRITNEQNRATNAETQLGRRDDSELRARRLADSDLQARISALTGNTTAGNPTNLAAETTARIAGDNALGSRIGRDSDRLSRDSDRLTGEINRATNAETQLGRRDDSELRARRLADSDLGVRITNEQNRATNAETQLGRRDDSELRARRLADSELRVSINDLGMDLAEVDERVTTRINRDSDRLDDDSDRLTAQVARLDGRINNQSSKDSDAVAVAYRRLDSELRARRLADSELTRRADSEYMARRLADSELTRRADSERANRLANDTIIYGRLDSELRARRLADSDLSTRINTTNSNLTSNVNRLDGRINMDSDRLANQVSRLDGRINIDSDRLDRDSELFFSNTPLTILNNKSGAFPRISTLETLVGENASSGLRGTVGQLRTELGAQTDSENNPGSIYGRLYGLDSDIRFIVTNITGQDSEGVLIALVNRLVGPIVNSAVTPVRNDLGSNPYGMDSDGMPIKTAFGLIDSEAMERRNNINALRGSYTTQSISDLLGTGFSSSNSVRNAITYLTGRASSDSDRLSRDSDRLTAQASRLDSRIDDDSDRLTDVDSDINARLDSELKARRLADGDLARRADSENGARIALAGALNTALANINAQHIEDSEFTQRVDDDSRARDDSERNQRIAADNAIISMTAAQVTSLIAVDSEIYRRIAFNASKDSDAVAVAYRRLDSELVARRLADSELTRRADSELRARRLTDSELRVLSSNLVGYLATIDAYFVISQRADSELTRRADSELRARRLADSDLARRADSEFTSRLANDTIIYGRLDSELVARLQADSELTHRADSELVARRLADSDLARRADSEYMARRLADSELTRRADSELRARRLADSELTRRADSEYTSRLANDTIIYGRLDSELRARRLADSDIRVSITNEMTARVRGDSDERAARRAADSELGRRINALQGPTNKTVFGVDSDAQTAIETETTRATNAEGMLGSRIDTITNTTLPNAVAALNLRINADSDALVDYKAAQARTDSDLKEELNFNIDSEIRILRTGIVNNTLNLDSDAWRPFVRNIQFPAATTTPLPSDSDGDVGTSTSYARADHVHPTPPRSFGLIASYPVGVMGSSFGTSAVGIGTRWLRDVKPWLDLGAAVKLYNADPTTPAAWADVVSVTNDTAMVVANTTGFLTLNTTYALGITWTVPDNIKFIRTTVAGQGGGGGNSNGFAPGTPGANGAVAAAILDVTTNKELTIIIASQSQGAASGGGATGKATAVSVGVQTLSSGTAGGGVQPTTSNTSTASRATSPNPETSSSGVTIYYPQGLPQPGTNNYPLAQGSLGGTSYYVVPAAINTNDVGPRGGNGRIPAFSGTAAVDSTAGAGGWVILEW